MQEENFDEEMGRVYKAVKELAYEGNNGQRDKSQINSYIRSRLRYKLGYRYNYHSVLSSGQGLYSNYGRDERRRMKRFYKSKYSRIGLPSKEQVMVDKMIESVVDSLEVNKISLANLSGVVAKVNSFTDRAKRINSDCEGIKTELDKIPHFLDTGSWVAEQ